MSFDQLIKKVHQAEDAVEAHERAFSADMRQMKRSWRAMWTPGRLIVAGLVSGFAVGKAQPLSVAARSGGLLRLVSVASTLFAGTGARQAADDAEDAADMAAHAARASDAATATAATAAAGDPPVP
ncbi:hypothetical protein H4F99_01285 [Lysobacter sp. SG-8]|uniref:Protein sip-5 n=1 Tax=Marilutibacter penaei TaxID=2759900 RepID=A0A7W3U1Z4_9GAMM|nr:hypothetical protein [Lysobacter penaei]MBB1087115.1 hypothetical protein [Lysobacter penaei]